MDSMEYLRHSGLMLLIISIAVVIPRREEEKNNILLEKDALETGHEGSFIYDEWSKATRDARRAFLTGSLEEMYNIKHVVAHQGTELKLILSSLKSQLCEKADCSKDTKRAFQIVDEQLQDIEKHHVDLISQANQNLDTVRVIATAQAETSRIIVWDSINKKLLTLLNELRSAGKKE